MPCYEFLCEKCQKPFERIMAISEREKGDVKCPTCKSTKVRPSTAGSWRRRGRRVERVILKRPPITAERSRVQKL